jgi:uncharacterized protein YlxP (DUF503 family)
MFVGFARLALAIPDARSLKDKRHVLHKVIDRVRARFNVAVAEVGENDRWQRASVGFSAVGNESAFVREVLDKVIHFVEEQYVAPILAREVEVVPVGDFYGPDDGSAFGSGARGTERTLAEAEAEAGLDDSVGSLKIPSAPISRSGHHRAGRRRR